MAQSLPKSKMLAQPRLHDELLVDEILTRLPAAAAVRCRAVCRAWNAALTSDHFLQAHGARTAEAHQPELLFFVPAAGATNTSFYTCAVHNGEAPAAARELLTVSNLSAEHVVLSPRPCHGLTLIFEAQASQYYVCNLLTGEHVALPPYEPAAAIILWTPSRIGMGFHLQMPPWIPFELSSAGLGFDQTSGEHKVVRLFKNRIGGQATCEVCTRGGSGGWRPCTGRAPPHAASFVAGLPPVSLNGSLYWLLDLAGDGYAADRPILSFSVGAEQFGWVHMPPLLSRRVGNLADLDGSLCAVVDVRHDADRYALFTWSSGGAASWSLRCSIYLRSLPQAISDEFVEEQDVIPLCSAGGKVLLATGRHKVFAYDPERNTMERVFYMPEFVDVPDRHRDARLRLSIGLHEERIAGVHRRTTSPDPRAGGKRLQVKRGSGTVGKREAVDENRDDRLRKLRDIFRELAGLPLPHMNNPAEL